MASPPIPTFYGHIASTQDALLLFEACLTGALNHVARRPHDGERKKLIMSGHVFIYEEHSSGIKRWTDGVAWSPSRILGNFLVYRELERPFPPGEKKRAMKRNKRSPAVSKAQEPPVRSTNASSNSYNTVCTSSFDSAPSSSINKEKERSLIGSLVDSYGFKDDGLVKKTVSVTVGGVSHHLVSYYTVADVMNDKFPTPSNDSRFRHIIPRQDLITKQNFRTPIDEVDSMDRLDERSVWGYPWDRSAHDLASQPLPSRSMPLPAPQLVYTPHTTAHSTNVYGSFGFPSGLTTFADNLPLSTSVNGYNGQFATVNGVFPPTRMDNYDLGVYRPRYDSAASTSSDTSRAQMPPAVSVANSGSRRPSTYDRDHSTGSGSSGTSGISAASIDSKLTHESGYYSQGFLSSSLKDTTSARASLQRSLPIPMYDRNLSGTYMTLENPGIKVENPGIKDGMWPMGNTSSGHGHYIAQHQNWAGAGGSFS